MKQRGNVIINNLQFLNAILYVAENGCEWRALPKEYEYIRTLVKGFKNRVLLNFSLLIGAANDSPFRRLKRFRRIFTRYNKLDILFAGFILLVFIIDSLV